jgi:diguanylate cyclase (GGDEF)-like protein
MPVTSIPAPPVARVTDWAVWTLPAALRAFVLSVSLVAALAVLYGLVLTPLHGDDLMIFGLLVGGGAVAVESRRRLGEPAGVKVHDLLSAWWLPITVLLPPVYALAAPIPLLAFSQWRVGAKLVHRRVFSAGAISLAYGGSSVVFHALVGAAGVDRPGARPLVWWLLFLTCGLLATVVNAVLVSAAVKLSDPQATWRELLCDREKTWLDVVELSAGLVVTLAAALSAVLVFAVLPALVMLQRSFMHAQLSAAARLDGKTGLLNAVSWEREAEAELARLYRSRQSAAVLLVDIDHFKAVNDTYGHLNGDRVLVAVADSLAVGLREADLLGRFGGEEFAVMLPTADQAEALGAAERLRSRVAGLAVPMPDADSVQVTISVGVSITEPPGLSVADLLAAADAELYHAKSAGRNQVHLGHDAGIGRRT